MGSQPHPRSFIPEELARKIRSADAALAGERKQVTVLFADVLGSMDLAEQIDPERWQAIMERFFRILCAGVHRFEGTVDKFTGDGIMALFGAPIAAENHAVHACHAALGLCGELERFSVELRREQGLSFRVRIGLNSGEVVVGSIGEDLAMEYTAVGHTVGLAQRMEALAEPGKAYLTERTAALVEGYFDLRGLGEFEVKGVHEPVRVYELAGVGGLRTRFEVARARGLSRFVGRERETAALESALAHARERNAQVICVVGEAGIGKSRLCYEFAERCRARGIDVWEGHCTARGETVPLLPVLELLRSYFGIGERDSGPVAREKIAARVVARDQSLKDELPLVFEFLGVGDAERPWPRMDPEARQRRLFETLSRLLAAGSEQSAAVYVLEDLQWIDPGSAALLENLVDALPGTRTLVVANFRPEYHAEWTQRSYCARVALAPLGAQASAQLGGELLGEDPSLDGLAEYVYERTAGNPFFIEELVQGLAEAGSLRGKRGGYRLTGPIEEQAIPVTVQAVIAARIDRLGEREKRLLQTAAVIGREFAEPVLRRVAGLAEPELRAALRALLNGELIYQPALVAERFSFKHQLIVEVAYRSQLGEPRARVHGAVARAIEELYPDSLDELAGLVARHLELAGEKLASARWGARAAAWAGHASPREALPHWRKVCELTDAVAESPEVLALGTWARLQILEFGWRLGAMDEQEARTMFEQARALAERSGNLSLSATLLASYTNMRVMAGEAAEHVGMALEAVALAAQSGDAGMQMATMDHCVWVLTVLGRLREDMDIVEQALALGADNPTLGAGIGSGTPYASAFMTNGALVGVLLGERTVEEARRDVERARELTLEYGDLEDTGWAHGYGQAVEWIAGDGDRALRHATAMVEIAERIGDSYSRGFAYSLLGASHLLVEEWEQASAALERGIDTLRQAHTGLCVQSWHLARLALAHLGAGRRERARETALEAVHIARQQKAQVQELEAQLSFARVLAQTEGASQRTAIEAALERAAALLVQTGARGIEPFVHEERARLAGLSGDMATRERELREAQRQFEAIGATPRAAALAAELAAALSPAGS